MWLLLVFGLLGMAYGLTIPLGEAPDEAAHVYYVDSILSHGQLPSLPKEPDAFNYQAHHPPLHYLVGALWLRAWGVQAVAFPAQPNPELRFDNTGSRAFVPRSWLDAERWPILLLRWLSLFWGLATVAALSWLFRTLLTATTLRTAALWTLALVPQLLFVSATVSNDSAAIALSTAALAALVAVAHQGSLGPGTPETSSAAPVRLATVAGCLVALGLFAKGTAFFLLAPVALLGLYWLWQRRWRLALALGIPVALGLLAWFALCWWRFGAFWPPPPTGYVNGLSESLAQLFQLRWLASLWISFWAKFGWFNLPLPWPLYLVFLLPTAAMAVGLVRLIQRISRRREKSDERSGDPSSLVAALLLSALAANLSLLVLFLLRVDFQPQGRFLLPSLGVLGVSAVLGVQGLAASRVVVVRRLATQWLWLWPWLLIAVNVFSLLWIRGAPLRT